MGGKVWNQEEERVFWEVVIPRSPCAANPEDRELTWKECVEVMQEAMGEGARREYTQTMLYEHHYQNFKPGSKSPRGSEFIEKHLRDVEWYKTHTSPPPPNPTAPPPATVRDPILAALLAESIPKRRSKGKFVRHPRRKNSAAASTVQIADDGDGKETASPVASLDGASNRATASNGSRASSPLAGGMTDNNSSTSSEEFPASIFTRTPLGQVDTAKVQLEVPPQPVIAGEKGPEKGFEKQQAAGLEPQSKKRPGSFVSKEFAERLRKRMAADALAALAKSEQPPKDADAEGQHFQGAEHHHHREAADSHQIIERGKDGGTVSKLYSDTTYERLLQPSNRRSGAAATTRAPEGGGAWQNHLHPKISAIYATKWSLSSTYDTHAAKLVDLPRNLPLPPLSSTVTMSLPSPSGPAAGAGAMPGMAGNDDPGVKAVKSAMESCFGKSIMSGVMGFAMGGAFGAFMASMSYDTPFHTATAGGVQTPISDLPWRQQLRIGFKDMGTRSWSMAKNFGKVGALYSGIECGVEGLRAKNDLVNSVASGCLTGGILAKNAGPQAAAGGCAAFAAFSLAIDAWMRQPKEE